MRPFAYSRASNVDEAARLFAQSSNAAFLAGGTNLIDLMKNGVTAPSRLIDVRQAVSRDIDRLPGGGLMIGAGVTNAELAGDAQVRGSYPVLAQAVLAGASGQIRNIATVGGNLLQRTRCVYFQDPTKPCNKRVPGSGCPAIEGHHRDLGLMGTSDHCVATNPSDMAVALAALDATVHVRTAAGDTATLMLDELYRLPGTAPQHDVTLSPGDIIVSVELPAPNPARMAYRKVRDRASYAFALVSVAAIVELDGNVVDSARIAFGGIAPRPWRARKTENRIAGNPPSAALFEQALHAELASARPLPRNAFKRDLVVSTAAALLDELTSSEGVDR